MFAWTAGRSFALPRVLITIMNSDKWPTELSFPDLSLEVKTFSRCWAYFSAKECGKNLFDNQNTK